MHVYNEELSLTPSFPPFNSSHPTWPAPNLLFCFVDNLLSPISAVHMFMGVGPSPGAWETYQWPYIKKEEFFSSLWQLSTADGIWGKHGATEHFRYQFPNFSWAVRVAMCRPRVAGIGFWAWWTRWVQKFAFQSTSPHPPALRFFLPLLSLSLCRGGDGGVGWEICHTQSRELSRLFLVFKLSIPLSIDYCPLQQQQQKVLWRRLNLRSWEQPRSMSINMNIYRTV